MIVCVDADYRADRVVAACVGFVRWSDAVPAFERTAVVAGAAPYVPGSFYLRELPAVLAVLARAPVAPSVIVVDAYVTLGAGRAGLGEHVRRALPGLAVVGVAKTPFRGSTHAVELLRGASKKPLFITASGVPPQEAARAIASMHGAFRIPTLLRRVDALARAS